MDVRSLIQVAGGGIAGAATRWAVDEVVGHRVAGLVLVNTAGAFLLGYLLRRHEPSTHHPRLWLTVGFCGALTTFSTLALDVAARLDAGEAGRALSTTLLVVGAGLAGAVSGNTVGANAARRRAVAGS